VAAVTANRLGADTEGCSGWLGLFLLCALQLGEMHSATLRHLVALRNFWQSGAGSLLLGLLDYVTLIYLGSCRVAAGCRIAVALNYC